MIQRIATLAQPQYRVFDSWQHQLEAYHHGRSHLPAAYLAMGMGTGKTKTSIDIAVNGGWDTIIVTCPVSVMGVWRREFKAHWPADAHTFDALVLDGNQTCDRKGAMVDEFMSRNPATCKAVVVNYESAWRGELRKVLLKQKFYGVIADELHRAKAPGGKSSAFMSLLGDRAQRRLGLSGTPMPHSPLDLYGQFRFLAPEIFGTNYARFLARYAQVHEDFPGMVLQWLNQDDLIERFHSITYECKSEDVLDLPPHTFEVRHCQLDSKTLRVYRELENDFVSEVEAGTVIASNALAKSLRLRQCTGGFVGGKDEFNTKFIQELGREKGKLLADMLEDIRDPVVVFAEFQHDLDVIQRVVEAAGLRYGELSGRRRDAITELSTMNPEIDVAGVQNQAGGVGIDLTRACYGIDFSPNWSLGLQDQKWARIRRPGQVRFVRLYALLAAGTIDEDVYAAIEKRRDIVDYILEKRGRVAA